MSAFSTQEEADETMLHSCRPNGYNSQDRAQLHFEYQSC